MKINVDLVLSARKQKSWSQEELAIDLGAQPPDHPAHCEASESLQSKKALASALDLDVHDLDYQEIQMRADCGDPLR